MVAAEVEKITTALARLNVDRDDDNSSNARNTSKKQLTVVREVTSPAIRSVIVAKAGATK